MKIGELARKTQVSKTLIHHYLREGLVHKPRATGPNSAEYDETHLERIQLIKELRDSYFLPLPLIKKIIKRQKKLPGSERYSFHLQNEYFRPMDRFFPCEVTGRDEFREVTGLGRHWLQKMEEWKIVSPEMADGEPVYSREEVVLGRLVVDMDRLGFGPRDGFSPEFLKKIGDFLRETLAGSVSKYMSDNRDKLNSKEFRDQGLNYTEVLSLFVYFLFRKIIKDEALEFLNSLEGGLDPDRTCDSQNKATD
jgi:DNA-binding transcriptional MerR regulator